MPRKATKSKKKASKPKAKKPNAPAKAVIQQAQPIGKNTLPNLTIARNLTQKLCSITDPFCDHARGGRWPDGNAFATVPFSNRAHIPVASFANGGTVVFATPMNLPFCFLNCSGWSGANYVMASSYASVTGPTTLVTTFEGYRPVSAGLVIRSLLTVTNTSGYIIVSRLAVMPNPVANIIAGGMLNPQVTTYPIVPGMEIPIVFRPMGVEARSFVDFTTTNTVPILDPSFDVIKIEVIGAPVTTNVLDIEIFFNYEMQLNPDSILAPTFAKGPSAQPTIQALSSKLADTATQAAHKSVTTLSEALERKASQLAARGMERFAEEFLG